MEIHLAKHHHNFRLLPPFFQEKQQATLLRYLDADFIPRFMQDIEKKRFTQPQFGKWQREEKHSNHDDAPVLRLPTHRTFHLVCCEAVCDTIGQPAVDPARIESAGFVIRRVGGQEEEAWKVEEGEPLGWSPAPQELRDPDLDRRLCSKGYLCPRPNQATYSGELTHPLHILTTTDENNKYRTLLYGYVPLGGFYYERKPESLFSKSSSREAEEFDAKSLLWPFGYSEDSHEAGKHIWSPKHGEVITRGVPSKAMFELLKRLVYRYHLGEAGRKENKGLETLCNDFWFYDETLLPKDSLRLLYGASGTGKFKNSRRFSLRKYFEDCFHTKTDNPLVEWLVEQQNKIDDAGGIQSFSSFSPMPLGSGKGNLTYSLTLTEGDAEEIRHMLGQRYRSQTLETAQEIPLPKFDQGSEDRYQLVPFIRIKNDEGKVQIYWGNTQSRSIPFRVAAPFDPEASRPSLIPMPSLADLKRGLAKGASMITPGDTYDFIAGLKLKKGASEDLIAKDTKTGIQWICSFSLPVITLVAMILLMIMISLLNIIFFWMPWVRICFPFPKNKQ